MESNYAKDFLLKKYNFFLIEDACLLLAQNTTKKNLKLVRVNLAMLRLFHYTQ